MSSNLLQPVLTQQPSNAPPAFHLLAKPTGAICNLDCALLLFLDKEVLYPGSKFRMSERRCWSSTYVNSSRRNQTNEGQHRLAGRRADADGAGFYRRVQVLVEKYRRPGMTFLHTMQTNGTLLNDDWVAS